MIAAHNACSVCHCASLQKRATSRCASRWSITARVASSHDTLSRLRMTS
jgi:hypothetical protein